MKGEIAMPSRTSNIPSYIYAQDSRKKDFKRLTTGSEFKIGDKVYTLYECDEKTCVIKKQQTFYRINWTKNPDLKRQIIETEYRFRVRDRHSRLWRYLNCYTDEVSPAEQLERLADSVEKTIIDEARSLSIIFRTDGKSIRYTDRYDAMNKQLWYKISHYEKQIIAYLKLEKEVNKTNPAQADR